VEELCEELLLDDLASRTPRRSARHLIGLDEDGG
jgi:hypothetical protein